MTGNQNILCEIADGVATVTLNRPEKLNPLDWATIRELNVTLGEFEGDPAIRVVIVTGAGRAFSAGGDLGGYLELYRNSADFARYLRDFHDLCRAIEGSAKPFVAAVNGVAVAGGLELILACDLVLASEDARIGDGHLNYAQLPGAGGSQRLPRAVGALRAKQLILTGELLSAAAAERIGLVGKVVPAAALMAEARALAESLMEKSATALKGAKHLVNAGLRADLAAGLELEMAYVHNYATQEPDAMEGLAAFAEDREPRYREIG